MDLAVCHPDREHFAVLHGDRQRLFARKRLHADQSPVPGFHRLRVDLFDLFFCKILTVFHIQTVRLFERTDCTLIVDLFYPDQFRAGELDLLHIRDELLRLIADLHIVQRQHSLLLCFCRFVSPFLPITPAG